MTNGAAVRFLLCLTALLSFPFARGQTNPEIRALWADTFHAGLRTAAEVSQLVAAARSGNFNTIIVEVRKRGDAYYNSSFEPKASDVSPQSFDPLADLITKAQTGGPRVEVHAWITTYLVWNSRTVVPSQASHPYFTRSNWFSRDITGSDWDGSNYQFDQGHPEAQRYVHDVAMDIISRYNVDGFHFDYIRYSSRNWGYHPIAVERFNRRFNRTGTPSATDPQWMQFRRDQVSALVRKVYLNAIALKPEVKISAATITWAPGITTGAQWYNSSAAWNSVLQDWRGWMEEGILDLNVPMMYFDQRRYATDWAAWSIFAKDHAYTRQVALGQGAYLNLVSNSIYQTRSSRLSTAQGNAAHGVAYYSYAVPGTNVTRSTVFNALTQPSAYDANPVPVFTNAVAPPVMPWKTAPSPGHLKGTITSAANGAELDGAIVSISGPVNRTMTNDGTGFYGFANLPAGTYSVLATFSNLVSESAAAIVSTGTVSTLNLALMASTGLSSIEVFPGRTEAVVRWRSPLPADSEVEWGPTAALGEFATLSGMLTTNHAVFVSGLAPNTNYFFRVRSRAGTNTFVSVPSTFRTAGEIVVDNPEAAFTGTWSLGTSATDKFGANYHFASTEAAAASARFVPSIATPGGYDVFVWYSQGGNRSTVAPFTIGFAGGTEAGTVNQTSGGGGWRLVGANKQFSRGTTGYFQWQNQTVEAARVVIADAVRFLYATNPVAAGTIPTWWAQAYFGSDVAPDGDPDNDGVTTAAEYVAGTDPTRAQSHVFLRLDALDSGVLRVQFSPFHYGRSYELQSASDVNSTNWLAVASPPTTANGTGTFDLTDPIAAQKFYRLRIRLSP